MASLYIQLLTKPKCPSCTSTAPVLSIGRYVAGKYRRTAFACKVCVEDYAKEHRAVQDVGHEDIWDRVIARDAIRPSWSQVLDVLTVPVRRVSHLPPGAWVVWSNVNLHIPCIIVNQYGWEAQVAVPGSAGSDPSLNPASIALVRADLLRVDTWKNWSLANALRTNGF